MDEYFLDETFDYGADEVDPFLQSDMDIESWASVNPGVKPEYINNNDYTLSSPLLSDHMDILLCYLKTGSSRRLFQRKSAAEITKTWLRCAGIPVKSLIPTKEFHKLVGKLIQHSYNVKNIITVEEDR